MFEGEKRALTRVKLIPAILIQICVIGIALGAIGAYIRFGDRIMPNIAAEGVKISGLTRSDAMHTLNLYDRAQRAETAKVTGVFPDGSELVITGGDVGFGFDAQRVIGDAFSLGRSDSLIADTVTFLRRLESGVEDFDISFGLDTEKLYSIVHGFTQSYNYQLEKSVPRIYDDRIVIVKGAGHVRACESEIFALLSDGLYESYEKGRPVVISCSLPETPQNVAELRELLRSIQTPVLSAMYDPETKSITDSSVGVDFNFGDALSRLNAAESGTSVTIDLARTVPEITHNYLSSFLFRDLIGSTVTRVSGTEDRLTNVILASKAVDGYILQPGEEFSFNKVVGRRTAAAGYRPGPMLSGGQTIIAIGGGICQVSSSIYSAIMDTDILVTERYPHGRPVDYLPVGRDATVSWGSLDFKYVNNTGRPLRIDASVHERTLTVQIFGTLPKSTLIDCS